MFGQQNVPQIECIHMYIYKGLARAILEILIFAFYSPYGVLHFLVTVTDLPGFEDGPR